MAMHLLPFRCVSNFPNPKVHPSLFALLIGFSPSGKLFLQLDQALSRLEPTASPRGQGNRFATDEGAGPQEEAAASTRSKTESEPSLAPVVRPLLGRENTQAQGTKPFPLTYSRFLPPYQLCQAQKAVMLLRGDKQAGYGLQRTACSSPSSALNIHVHMQPAPNLNRLAATCCPCSSDKILQPQS